MTTQERLGVEKLLGKFSPQKSRELYGVGWGGNKAKAIGPERKSGKRENWGEMTQFNQKMSLRRKSIM